MAAVRGMTESFLAAISRPPSPLRPSSASYSGYAPRLMKSAAATMRSQSLRSVDRKAARRLACRYAEPSFRDEARENRSENQSDREQNPTPFSPCLAEARHLHEDVSDIRREAWRKWRW